MHQIYIGAIWNIERSVTGKPALTILHDGALACDSFGQITYVGSRSKIPATLKQGRAVIDFGERIIMPGFIDTHMHAPQLDIIGCFGEDLLGWLNKYTFPHEERFAKAAVALDTAERLFSALKCNAISTAMLFSSSHASATEQVFIAAERSGLRAIIGKVSMDRHAPASLLNDPSKDLEETRILIDRWHGRSDLLYYALTPRFSPTCTPELMRRLGEMKAKIPSLFVQTHHAENKKEIAWVESLFPKNKDYLSTYEDAGLLGVRTVFAHCVHATPSELRRIENAKALIAHCPSSNLFLGSGLFPWRDTADAGAAVSIASDIGGGFCLSPWKNMALAHAIQRTRQDPPFDAAALMAAYTIDPAAALGLNCGSLTLGKSADFQVVDPYAAPLLKQRFAVSDDPLDKLFALIHLGDDRVTEKLFVKGRCVYDRTAQN